MNNNSEEKHRKDLEAAKNWYKIAEQQNNEVAMNILKDLFPELNENENIGTQLVNSIKSSARLENCLQKHGFKIEEVIAWLEKQQDNNEDSNILQRFSFYSYKDEPNILYLSGLYVNKECRNKGIGTKILEVAEKVAKSLNCHTIRLKTKKDSNAERLYRACGYNSLATEERDEIWLEKQVEQKPADMEERIIKDINNLLTQLFQKMHEAGYEWDAEKKELKKIKQSCYHNDGLYYAIDILEKTLGKVEGYQSDDGIIEHQTAIETVNVLYHKKLAKWSEEDELHLKNAILAAEKEWGLDSFTAKWLKSIKDRVQPQPKQEWSEEDEKMLNDIIVGLTSMEQLIFTQDVQGKTQIQGRIDWLKSLKPQNRWKPSDLQLEALESAYKQLPNIQYFLQSLYNDLKNI